MNNKISNAQLARLLAARSGLELKVCETYITELVNLIRQTLSRGENVKITGFGTFKLNRVEDRRSVDVTTGAPTVISGHTKVVFIPAKEMAALANAPFAMFEAVELVESLSVGELSALNEAESTETAEEPESPEAGEGIETADDADSVDESEVTEKSNLTGDAESSALSEPTESPDNPESRLPVKYVYPDREVEAMGRRKFSYGFMVGFISAIIAIGAIVGCYWYFYHNVEQEEAEVEAENELVEQQAAPLDSIAAIADSALLTDTPDTTAAEAIPEPETVRSPQAEQVATAPSDAPVYDTVTKTRYLTTIAKEHYGSYHFWPYIYEENKARLGHPDRIRPGTRVVVPSLSKYGVSPSRPADVEAAKRLGTQIYARFK